MDIEHKNEISDYIVKMCKETRPPTIIDKLRLMLVPRDAIERMRHTLLDQGKKIYFKYANTYAETSDYDFVLNNSSNEQVYFLYKKFEHYQNAIGKTYEEVALWSFIGVFSVCFMKKGYLRSKQYSKIYKKRL